MYRPKLVTGYIYHVYNRGTDKREIFPNDGYYTRFLSLLEHCLKYSYPYSALKRRLGGANSPEKVKVILTQLQPYIIEPPVEIISFCLMPNHYHLTVRQLVEGGLTEFMRRLGTGYTNYFNIRLERTGRLFESTYKTVPVESEGQLLHLTRYQHTNPTSLGLNSQELVNYPWSSLATYVKATDTPFSFVTPKDILAAFKNPKAYLDFVLAEVDRYEPFRLREVAIDDDFGWFAALQELAEERRTRLREAYLAITS